MTERTLTGGGVVTMWRLARATWQLTLAAALEAIGRGDIAPNVRTRDACMKTALDSIVGNSRTLIRSLAKKEGYQVTIEQQGEDSNDYHGVFTVKLDTNETRDELQFDPFPGYALAQQIQEAYQDAKPLLVPWQVGQVLNRTVQVLGGVSLLEQGGTYWIPESVLPQWEEVARACESAAAKGATSVSIFRSPMDENALKAVSEALAAEVATETATLQGQILSGELKSRALRSLQGKCDELVAKVTGYEGILGRTLDVLKEQVETVNTSAATAILLAAAQPDEETAQAA